MIKGALPQPSLIGSKERPLMKKEGTSKLKELKRETSDKKEATPKCKGLKRKTSDKKRDNPKTQGVQKKDLRGKKR
jgi:hypothetical protein